jgi:hypothetical protein
MAFLLRYYFARVTGISRTDSSRLPTSQTNLDVCFVEVDGGQQEVVRSFLGKLTPAAEVADGGFLAQNLASRAAASKRGQQGEPAG